MSPTCPKPSSARRSLHTGSEIGGRTFGLISKPIKVIETVHTNSRCSCCGKGTTIYWLPSKRSQAQEWISDRWPIKMMFAFGCRPILIIIIIISFFSANVKPFDGAGPSIFLTNILKYWWTFLDRHFEPMSFFGVFFLFIYLFFKLWGVKQ